MATACRLQLTGGGSFSGRVARYNHRGSHTQIFSTYRGNLTMSRRRTDPLPSDLSPLAYLLSIVRDPKADAGRRDRLAIAALPYCHARLAEKTKKAVEAEAAEQAGADGEWGADLAEHWQNLHRA
jgi:hypothetical protein